MLFARAPTVYTPPPPGSSPSPFRGDGPGPAGAPASGRRFRATSTSRPTRARAPVEGPLAGRALRVFTPPRARPRRAQARPAGRDALRRRGAAGGAAAARGGRGAAGCGRGAAQVPAGLQVAGVAVGLRLQGGVGLVGAAGGHRQAGHVQHDGATRRLRRFQAVGGRQARLPLRALPQGHDERRRRGARRGLLRARGRQPRPRVRRGRQGRRGRARARARGVARGRPRGGRLLVAHDVRAQPVVARRVRRQQRLRPRRDRQLPQRGRVRRQPAGGAAAAGALPLLRLVFGQGPHQQRGRVGRPRLEGFRSKVWVRATRSLACWERG
jgi:hypothetical protein